VRHGGDVVRGFSQTTTDPGFDGLIAACPACGALLDADARRCGTCGSDLRDAVVALLPEGDAHPDERARPRLARWATWGRSAVLPLAAAAVCCVLVADGVAAARVRSPGCQPVGQVRGALPLFGRCTGTVLVVEAPGAIQTVDLDHGRLATLSTATWWPGAAPLTPSAGRVAAVGAMGAVAVPLGGGAPVRLGPAESVLDDGGGGWWIVSPSSEPDHGLVRQVARRANGSGVVAGPPVLLGSGVTPVGGVSGGLLVAGSGNRLAVIGGSHPGPLGSDLGAAYLLAAGGDHVLLTASPPGRPAGLWLVDVATGREAFLGSSARASAGANGSVDAKFSPDGRWLAMFVPFPGPYPSVSAQLMLVDLRRGTATAVPGGGTAAPEPVVAWSPDSRWVFFLQAGGPVDRTIGTYHLGDHTAGVLNYFPGPVVGLASTRS
jgi:hypothetical protein